MQHCVPLVCSLSSTAPRTSSDFSLARFFCFFFLAVHFSRFTQFLACQQFIRALFFGGSAFPAFPFRSDEKRQQRFPPLRFFILAIFNELPKTIDKKVVKINFFFLFFFWLVWVARVVCRH